MMMVLALTLAGCSSSSSSDGDGGSGGSDTPTGVFLDGGLVEGLDYSTDTHSGTTDADGTFTYEEGETVTFTIGDVPFGEAEGAAVVTSWDLAQNEDPENSLSFIQRIVALQSIDDDQDVSNGIAIHEGIAEAMQGQEFDFSASGTVGNDLNTIIVDVTGDGTVEDYHYMTPDNALNQFIAAMDEQYDYPVESLAPDTGTGSGGVGPHQCVLWNTERTAAITFSADMDADSASEGTILIFELDADLLLDPAGVNLEVSSPTEWGIWEDTIGEEGDQIEHSILIVLKPAITSAGGEPLPAPFFWTFLSNSSCF